MAARGSGAKAAPAVRGHGRSAVSFVSRLVAKRAVPEPSEDSLTAIGQTADVLVDALGDYASPPSKAARSSSSSAVAASRMTAAEATELLKQQLTRLLRWITLREPSIVAGAVVLGAPTEPLLCSLVCAVAVLRVTAAEPASADDETVAWPAGAASPPDWVPPLAEDLAPLVLPEHATERRIEALSSDGDWLLWVYHMVLVGYGFRNDPTPPSLTASSPNPNDESHDKSSGKAPHQPPTAVGQPPADAPDARATSPSSSSSLTASSSSTTSSSNSTGADLGSSSSRSLRILEDNVAEDGVRSDAPPPPQPPQAAPPVQVADDTDRIPIKMVRVSSSGTDAKKPPQQQQQQQQQQQGTAPIASTNDKQAAAAPPPPPPSQPGGRGSAVAVSAATQHSPRQPAAAAEEAPQSFNRKDVVAFRTNPKAAMISDAQTPSSPIAPSPRTKLQPLWSLATLTRFPKEVWMESRNGLSPDAGWALATSADLSDADVMKVSVAMHALRRGIRARDLPALYGVPAARVDEFTTAVLGKPADGDCDFDPRPAVSAKSLGLVSGPGASDMTHALFTLGVPTATEPELTLAVLVTLEGCPVGFAVQPGVAQAARIAGKKLNVRWSDEVCLVQPAVGEIKGLPCRQVEVVDAKYIIDGKRKDQRTVWEAATQPFQKWLRGFAVMQAEMTQARDSLHGVAFAFRRLQWVWFHHKRFKSKATAKKSAKQERRQRSASSSSSSSSRSSRSRAPSGDRRKSRRSRSASSSSSSSGLSIDSDSDRLPGARARLSTRGRDRNPSTSSGADPQPPPATKGKRGGGDDKSSDPGGDGGGLSGMDLMVAVLGNAPPPPDSAATTAPPPSKAHRTDAGSQSAAASSGGDAAAATAPPPPRPGHGVVRRRRAQIDPSDVSGEFLAFQDDFPFAKPFDSAWNGVSRDDGRLLMERLDLSTDAAMALSTFMYQARNAVDDAEIARMFRLAPASGRALVCALLAKPLNEVLQAPRVDHAHAPKASEQHASLSSSWSIVSYTIGSIRVPLSDEPQAAIGFATDIVGRPVAVTVGRSNGAALGAVVDKLPETAGLVRVSAERLQIDARPDGQRRKHQFFQAPETDPTNVTLHAQRQNEILRTLYGPSNALKEWLLTFALLRPSAAEAAQRGWVTRPVVQRIVERLMAVYSAMKIAPSADPGSEDGTVLGKL